MDKTEKEALQGVRELKSERYIIAFKSTPDKLKLFVDCEPQPGITETPLTLEELQQLLSATVPEITYDTALLQDIVTKLNQGEKTDLRRVAKGEAPIPGRDGKLVFLVKKFEKSGSLEFVDPRFIRQFDNIEPGMIVARVYPPVPGVPGVDVFGKTIESPPAQPFTPDVDDTLQIVPPAASETYSKLVAQAYGYLEVQGKKLGVRTDLIVSGDVDYSIGDIEFNGKVIIRGNVNKGFKVTTRGDIEVSGDVIGGRLLSTQGSIIVRGDIIGDGTADLMISSEALLGPTAKLTKLRERPEQVIASQKVQASLVEGATIAAGSDIEVSREIRGSHVRTRGFLKLRTGTIVGGETATVSGIEVGTVGSKAGTTTLIRLLNDVESSSAFRDIAVQLKVNNEAQEMINLYLGPYVSNPKLLERLAKEKKQRLITLLDKLAKLHEMKKQLEDERRKMLCSAKYISGVRLNYHELLYAGTVISVGDEKLEIKEETYGKGTIFFDPESETFLTTELQPFDEAKKEEE